HAPGGGNGADRGFPSLRRLGGSLMGHPLPRGLLGIGLLLLLGFGLQALQSGAWLDQAWIDTEVRGRGLHGEWLFVLAGLLLTALGLPRQVVGFFAGYAF